MTEEQKKRAADKELIRQALRSSLSLCECLRGETERARLIEDALEVLERDA